MWLKAKATSQRPSQLLGLESDSYEAYCLDEAVIYFGMAVEHDLEKIGHKPSKGERKEEAARQRYLDKLLADDAGVDKKVTGFADPALMF